MGCANHYHHFSEDERERFLREIQQQRASGCVSVSSLARCLGRSRRTVRRELRRGRPEGADIDFLIATYNPISAEKHAKSKSSNSVRKGKKSDAGLLGILRLGISERHHSPDQIIHTAVREAGFSVSVATVYSWLHPGGPLQDCREKLRFKGRARKSKYSRTSAAFRDAKTLDQRPAGCTDRTEFGHFEGDTVVSGKDSKACLFTFVDRKTRLTFIYKADDGTTLSFDRAVKWLRKRLPKGALKSLTLDRGSEFSDWKRVEKVYGIPIYFCDSHHPEQKGTNENTNGLIREFYPKKTDFSKVKQSEINDCARMLNTRPKKILGYKTPWELFRQECSNF